METPPSSVRISVTLPSELRDRIRHLATADLRSQNAEIIQLLREALAARQQPPTEGTNDRRRH